MRPAFLGGAARNPLGDGLTLFVVGEVVCECLGVELELARGSVEREVLWVFVETAHAGQLVAPVLFELGVVETLFDEGVPIDLGGEVRIGEAVLEPLVGGHAEVELFALAKAIEHFEGDFPVGLRNAHAIACVRGVARPAHADGH